MLIAEVGRRERATFDRELRATTERMVVPARRGRTAQLDRLAGDASVRLLTRGRETYDNLRAPELPISKNGLRTVTAEDGSSWRVMRRGRLLVARPLALVEDRIGDLQRTIAFAALLGLLATARRRAVRRRPLAAPTRHVARPGREHHHHPRPGRRVGPGRGRRGRHSLNAMLARLEASVAATERFTADAGHELRTPLTSASGPTSLR